MARRKANSNRAAADAVMSFIHSLDVNSEKLNITKVLGRCMVIQRAMMTLTLGLKCPTR